MGLRVYILLKRVFLAFGKLEMGNLRLKRVIRAVIPEIEALG